MRRATAMASMLSLLVPLLWAAIAPVITSEVTMNTYVNPSGGDTWWITAWAKSESWGSGNFSGGKVFGVWNDGSWGGGTSYNVGLVEVISYPITGAGSMSVRNQMTSYGTVNTKCFGGGSYHKTAAPWMWNGNLYLAISCLDTNNFNQRAAGIIISPDGGLHWCNWKTYQAGGNTCTSSNWKADGDAPVDAAGYQWWVGDFDTSNIHSFTRNIVMCQDNTVNCPQVAGMDNANYLYFLQSASNDGPFHIYARAVSKSLDLMDPANWLMFLNGSFVADSGTPTDLIATYNMTDVWHCCVSIAFLPNFKQFIGISPNPYYKYSTAPLPWSNWTNPVSFTPPVNDFVWNVFAPWGFSVSNGHLTGVLPASNGTANGLNFYNFDLGVAPFTSSVRFEGKAVISGKVRIE